MFVSLMCAVLKVYGLPSISSTRIEAHLWARNVKCEAKRSKKDNSAFQLLGPQKDMATIGVPEEIGAPDWKTDNGENARMHETNT